MDESFGRDVYTSVYRDLAKSMDNYRPDSALRQIRRDIVSNKNN